MADIICRWRNATPKTVCQFVSVLPKEQMSSERFRDIMDKQTLFPDFFHTSYQLACQLGLYCEEDGLYVPRFSSDIDESEARAYLSHWIRWYYAPNPFTKSLKSSDTPKYVVSELLLYVQEHGATPIKEALEYIYDDKMGNLDIVINALNNFSQILKVENQIVDLTDNFKEYMYDMPRRNDRDSFFKNFNKNKLEQSSLQGKGPLQVIYYGAPGTGKSYEINRQSAGYPTFRTTFHPDSDYASFVGAYKPISKKGNWVTRAVDRSGEILTEKVLKDNEGKVVSDSKIVYEYTFQTFLKAYQKAWEEQTKENPSKVFLVIEELNRGNCAQIFGDLFQLLDRNENGFSQYAIDADADMGAELGTVLKNLDILKSDFINSQYPGTEDMVSDVKEGRKLLLPNNLHIWATMNTSDQSLFPIDSAFKRRWDWKYVKISDAGLNYKIAVNGNEYDWWSFIKSINYMIGKDLDQEDKQLGYFFAKTNRDENGNYLISADSFLSKVIFFIYNDVYKDYGFDDAIFQDEEGELIEFADYFDDMGNADQEKVERFIKNVIKKGENLKLISYTRSPEDETAD